MPTLSPPRPSVQHGYGCKVWISRRLEEKFRGGSHFVWFCRELNPLHNGDSSNPLWLYLTIDRAVKSGDLFHPKIQDLRAKLSRVVGRLLRPTDPSLARRLKREITRAPLEMFRPQLWRLELGAIAPDRIRTDGANPRWDEEYLEDLTAGEFEVIVE